MNLSDEELAARFERIFIQHQAPLARLTAAYTADPENQADLLQEILVAIWRALPGFEGRCSERTFVFRIAHNRGVTYRQRGRAHARIEEARDVPDPGPSPEEAVSAAHDRERLVSAVHRLPPALRQAIMLHLEGLTHQEIASVLGISENNVAVRLNRGRSFLRRHLQPEMAHP